MVILNMLDLLPWDYQQRVLVLAAAPGGYIPKKKCRDVIHLVNNKDVVPWLHATGWIRAKMEKTIIQVRNPQKLKNVHNFQNEIYRPEMQQRIKDYLANPRKKRWRNG